MSTAASPAPASEPAPRAGRGSRLVDLFLALVAHAALGASWVVTAAAIMGSLDVARRMVMNSEFAWDTGRLPQPWVIPLGLLAAWVSHRFFLWIMRRLGQGRLPYGGRAVAWAGALLGVLLGAYLWTPALQVGAQVGPASGDSTPWGILGWAAHYARPGLPALVGLITGFLVLFSKHSPLVVAVKALGRWWRGRRARRSPGTRADAATA